MPRDKNAEFWVRAIKALTAIALARTKNQAQAEDLAQQAIEQALPDWHAGEDLRSFVSRASALMRRNASNERRAAAKREDPMWKLRVAGMTSGLRRTPEDLASTRELKERLFARAFEQLKGDRVGTGIVEQFLQGNDTAAEQQEALGEDIETIRNARRRVKRVVDAIAAAEGATDLVGDWDADEGRGAGDEEEEVEVQS